MDVKKTILEGIKQYLNLLIYLRTKDGFEYHGILSNVFEDGYLEIKNERSSQVSIIPISNINFWSGPGNLKYTSKDNEFIDISRDELK